MRYTPEATVYVEGDVVIETNRNIFWRDGIV